MRDLRSELVEARRIARAFGPILVARSLRVTAEAAATGVFLGGLWAFAIAGGA